MRLREGVFSVTPISSLSLSGSRGATASCVAKGEEDEKKRKKKKKRKDSPHKRVIRDDEDEPAVEP